MKDSQQRFRRGSLKMQRLLLPISIILFAFWPVLAQDAGHAMATASPTPKPSPSSTPSKETMPGMQMPAASPSPSAPSQMNMPMPATSPAAGPASMPMDKMPGMNMGSLL